MASMGHPKLWLVLGSITVSLGAMVSSLPNWQAAVSPAFIGGAFGVIGTALGALYAEKPEPKE